MLRATVEAQVDWALSKGVDFAGVLQRVGLVHNGALIASAPKLTSEPQWLRFPPKRGRCAELPTAASGSKVEGLPAPFVGRSSQRMG